ncbi:hypothetical protein EC973_006570 [Apophysomyces ossiformis]|uniref:Uncharacterized protein n=1 Tax=Apophysomyces ossiformis TaxID=679940 RepID=A0A8H7BVU5_9FUNG|nr:hypothetical protein EC973_006570 [Apophysomyces ossiformis]
MCSFCGIVSCDLYRECPSGNGSRKLYQLQGLCSLISKLYLGFFYMEEIDIDDIEALLRDVGYLDSPEEGYLNPTEIGFLLDYLASQNMTLADAWKECLLMIDSGEYVCCTSRMELLRINDTKTIAAATALSDSARDVLSLLHTERQSQPETQNSTAEEQHANEPYTREQQQEEEDRNDNGVSLLKYATACYTCGVNIVNGQLFGFWAAVRPEELPGRKYLTMFCFVLSQQTKQ